jgi:hypothetical protein
MRRLLPLALVLASVAVPAAASAQTKVLFVPAPTLPSPLRRSLPRILSTRAELVSTDAYERAARRRRMRASSDAAIRRLGSQRGASVIVVAGFATQGRGRTLRMRYYHGRSGQLAAARTYQLRGIFIHGAVQGAIVSDIQSLAGGGGRSARTASREEEPRRAPREDEGGGEESGGEEGGGEEGGEEGGEGDLPPPSWEDEGGEGGEGDLPPPLEDEADGGEEGGGEEGGGEEGGATPGDRQWGIGVAAGGGFGQRSSTVPLEAGEARFSSSPFPVVGAALTAWLRPDSASAFRVGVGARYYTSIGLQAQDQRSDGTTRTVDTRVQQLAIGLNSMIPLAEGPGAVKLELELGWGFRMLSSELPLSMPNYTLSGPYARVGLFFPIGTDSPLSIGIVPELGHVSSVSDELTDQALVSDGVLAGAEAQIRFTLIPELDIELVYREAHAFVSSERETNMNDVERFGVLRVVYKP